MTKLHLKNYNEYNITNMYTKDFDQGLPSLPRLHPGWPLGGHGEHRQRRQERRGEEQGRRLG